MIRIHYIKKGEKETPQIQEKKPEKENIRIRYGNYRCIKGIFASGMKTLQHMGEKKKLGIGDIWH